MNRIHRTERISGIIIATSTMKFEQFTKPMHSTWDKFKENIYNYTRDETLQIASKQSGRGLRPVKQNHAFRSCISEIVPNATFKRQAPDQGGVYNRTILRKTL